MLTIRHAYPRTCDVATVENFEKDGVLIFESEGGAYCARKQYAFEKTSGSVGPLSQLNPSNI